MNVHRRRAVILLTATLLLTVPLLVHSAPGGDRGKGKRYQRHADTAREYGGPDLDSAVSRARERTGGRVLSAETRSEEGEDVHIIRIITEDGRVRRLRVDAESGQLLRAPGKR